MWNMIFSHPLYIISTLTGLCVFNTQGKFSSILAVYSFLALSSLCSVGLYYRISLALYHSNNFQFDVFSHALPTLSFIIKVLTCLLHLLVSIVRRKEFENTLKTLRFEKNSLLITISVTIGGVGCSTIYYFQLVRILKWPVYLNDWREPHTIDSACVVCLTTLCYYINLQFCCLLEIGKCRISNLMERLSRGHAFTDSQHLQLVEALEQTNRLYGVQTMFNCSQAFTYLLTNAYFISTFAAFEFTPEPEYRKALECHVVFSLVMIYQMAYFSSETENRVGDFNNELGRMVRCNPNLRRSDRLQLYVLESPSVEFNACGFFSIGYPLITSVLAATVTYGVILIQSEMG